MSSWRFRALALVIAFLPLPLAPGATATTEPLKAGNAADAQPRSAQEQLKCFLLPEGFTIELVASEATGLPKPTCLAFDEAGRLWSATGIDYPRDRDPDVWKKPGRDRIAVIDAPHLPDAQPVRTFAAGMVMPLSVLPHAGGAFVAQGPEILFLRDTNGDGAMDQRTVLLRGFGIQDTHTLPHQLARVPGGRIAFSQGVLNSGVVIDADGSGHLFNRTLIASFTPEGTDLRFLGAGLNNIWAWAQDRLGRVFIHEANDLGYSLVPFEEDSSYPAFIETKLHPDAPLHPPTAEGLNLGGTGFCGIAISDDPASSFSASSPVLYVANPILGRIHVVAASLRSAGTWDFKKEEDLVTCTDPMFRPVAISFGPDGCLYIADWYNRIISHNEVARDHPGRDKEHGRIWRVRHRDARPATIIDFTKMPTERLPAALRSERLWNMRSAWQQLALRQDKSVIPNLIAHLEDTRASVDGRIHALWSLEELAYFEPNLWRGLLVERSDDLRRESVRALGALEVPVSVGAPLLRALADETAWSVRYAVLRYFRRASGHVPPEHLKWIQAWRGSAAPTNQVPGWKGPYLALDGSYQRAFQNFLLTLVETKTQLPVVAGSRWNGVIAKHSASRDSRGVASRIAAVRAALPSADRTQGGELAKTLCLTCHSFGREGVGFAPPLDGSANRDLEGFITAIVDPNAAIESVFRNYRIETKDGRTLEGFNQSETRQAITLLSMGGAVQSVTIKEIQAAGYIDGQSVMPDLTAAMSPEQVASLAAYLRSLP